jgi:hypothetical protein
MQSFSYLRVLMNALILDWHLPRVLELLVGLKLEI